MSKSYTICRHCRKINRFDHERADSAVCANCKQSLAIQGPTVEVDEGTLSDLIAKSPVPVIVDFWAPWCGPCRSFAPVFAQVAAVKRGEAIFAKLNTEDHPTPSARFGIRGIPTLMVFNGGQEIARQSGAMDARRFSDWLSKFTAKA